MFAVKLGDKLWGPFKSADAAAKWADKNLDSSCVWLIVPLRPVR